MTGSQLLISSIACGVIAAAVLRLDRPPRSAQARDFASTEELIGYLASEAVDIAKKDYGVSLDYSLGSIEQVETILGQMHEHYAATGKKDGMVGLASAFGAYVGECIRRHVPGSQWQRDHPIGGERSFPLSWQGGDSFPMAWCHKRLLNGPEDNVWHKYQLLAQQREEGDAAK